ncbi:Gfo/Idh/MocA family oxidoreductase [Schlesneria paludicola]|uniref:oxidoreductase n=1 Tax=Schlesneria paludicola TaxID=360056 RepID=UPI00029A77DC|nr:oxidoreductase [Schlesneria paludicola]
MSETSRRDRVGLGLIGLGPIWEQHYREPLSRLRNRLTIRMVYDPVEGRSKSIASDYGAEVAHSLTQVLRRPTLQGLIILDPGWCTTGFLNLVIRGNKPAFLSSQVLSHAANAVAALGNSVNHGDAAGLRTNAAEQLIPELCQRFTPASCRLRELIATRLGPVVKIAIEADLSHPATETASLVDWCLDLMGQAPTISPAPSGESTAGIDFTFAARTSSNGRAMPTPRTATLRHLPADNALIRVQCERGTATLPNRAQIRWETAAESADESLTDERTETEILIDQFCRRALGGLNPIGRLSEFVQALEIVNSIPLRQPA